MIDSNGYNITISQPLLHYAGGPALDGGLTKVGGGKLSLGLPQTTTAAALRSTAVCCKLPTPAPWAQADWRSIRGLLDLNSFSLSVPSLAGAAGVISDLSSTSGSTTLSVSQAASTTFGGAIQDGAQRPLALSKGGAGTLTLAGSNTYSGPTNVNQGLLQVNGSLTSPVTVNSGGILGGTGYLGSVTVASGGQIAPADALGVMHLSGSLDLLSGALMDYEPRYAFDERPDFDAVRRIDT